MLFDNLKNPSVTRAVWSRRRQPIHNIADCQNAYNVLPTFDTHIGAFTWAPTLV